MPLYLLGHLLGGGGSRIGLGLRVRPVGLKGLAVDGRPVLRVLTRNWRYNSYLRLPKGRGRGVDIGDKRRILGILASRQVVEDRAPLGLDGGAVVVPIFIAIVGGQVLKDFDLLALNLVANDN